MLFHKVMESYEEETCSLTNLNEKFSARPSLEQWLDARQVIEHWDRTIRKVAEKDMDHADFLEFENAVLNTLVMDSQILYAIAGFPKKFHMAMIPDLKASYEETLNSEALDLQEPYLQYWKANMNKFRIELGQDHVTIRRTNSGSAALADYMEWLDLKSKIVLQQTSQQLAQNFLSHYFPSVSSPDWQRLPGSFAIAMKKEVPRSSMEEKTGLKLLIINANFNTPHARDAMQLNQMAGALASIVQQAGAENVVVVCAMATRPKEDSLNTDVLDRICSCSRGSSLVYRVFSCGCSVGQNIIF